jgi:dihydroflavonol-4-reductase
MSNILVTGGSGFVGGHVILQLLEAGHDVRTTVRSLSKEQAVRDTLAHAGAKNLDRLSFVAADLNQDDGWSEAVAGREYVQHVASPFPLGQPKDENDLIRPAVDGTLRVLRAARDAGVKRVVLTSSFAAVGYGHGDQAAAYTEADWTDVDGPAVQPYMKSKALAERAAWDFVEREGNGLELAVVNPVGIFGPVLNEDLSTSIEIIKRMLEGGLPGAPRLYFGVVDVRDVAGMQIKAMTAPEAKGERFLAVAGEPVSIYDMSVMLQQGMGEKAAKAKLRQMPDWVIRVMALFNPLAREAAPRVGIRSAASNAKAREQLGWQFRSNQEAIVASGESLIRLGIVQ